VQYSICKKVREFHCYVRGEKRSFLKEISFSLRNPLLSDTLPLSGIASQFTDLRSLFPPLLVYDLTHTAHVFTGAPYCHIETDFFPILTITGGYYTIILEANRFFIIIRCNRIDRMLNLKTALWVGYPQGGLLFCARYFSYHQSW
jgi:hypothetical protein